MNLDFITYEIWENALNLIEFQVKQKKTNKHYRTFNIEYFNKLSDTYRNKVKSVEYFNEIIKTKIFDLRKEDNFFALLKELKKVSLEYDEYLSTDDTKFQRPQEKFDEIMNQIEKYDNSENINLFISSNDDTSIEIFKELFDPSVSNLIHKPENLKKIEYLLENINFKIVKLFPKPLMVLITLSEKITKKFKDYINSKKENLNTSDINIILEYLSQVNFEDDELFNILKDAQNFKEIFRLFTKEISNNELEKLKKIEDIIKKQEILEQIRLRRLNESLENYQLALNHLVNEFQSIIFEIDDNGTKNIKEYKSTSIENFLNKKDVNRADILTIIRMFDRRNNNLISHAGTEKDIYTYLTKEEYNKYKCIAKRIINAIT